MLIRVAAVGQKMPSWVTQGWQDYAKRFPRGIRLEVREIPLQRRGNNADIERLRQQEGQALLASVPKGAKAVALEITGQAWSTEKLAAEFKNWMTGGRDICLLVGGPDGLSAECLSAAEGKWSLGPLTLPHPLVRLVLAEQIYRAWTINNHHPYHRA
jgi:23S rRNA (pseudouridine1915-N3)-methyltransferase